MDSPRVLVVDDEAINRRLVQSILEPAGYRVMTASEGKEALEKAAMADAILLDLMMPGMSGEEVVRHLKSDARTKHIPVVVVTAAREENLRDQVLLAGAEDFLFRPVKRLELLARLRNLIRRKREHDLLEQDKRDLNSIVERKVQELETSQQLLHDAINSFSDHIAILDSKGTIVGVNESWRRFCVENGGPAHAFLRQSYLDATLDPELEDAAVVRTAIESILKGESTVPFDFRYSCHAPGEERWFRMRISGFHGNGQTHAIVAHENVTTLVKTNEFLETSRQELVQARKMEALGQLAGGIAHDFNNMLTVILNYGALVRDRVDEADDLQHDLDEMLNAASRAADLTAQLLAFARKERAPSSQLQVSRALRALLPMLARSMGEHIEVLVGEIDPSLVVGILPGQFDQLIMNLVLNAKDAMPNGGRVEVSADRLVVDSDTQKLSPGDYVRIAVVDTGTGMDEDTVQRVFEPFFTTKPLGSGTGLGLASCYHIVQAAGGAIDVSSAPGRGTRMEILLPRVAPAAPNTDVADADRAGPPRSKGQELVLLAEDERAIRKMLCNGLEAHGYEVVIARNGREAIEELEEGLRPTLIVSDVLMPDRNGYEVTRAAETLCPETPVLLISGFSGSVPKSMEELASRTPMLNKPFDIETLLRTARELIDGTEAR